MTLFNFEYLPYEPKSYVKPIGINIIDLRAVIVGLRIVWELRHKMPRHRKQENRQFLKHQIEYLRGVKNEYPFEYAQAYELSFLEAPKE